MSIQKYLGSIQKISINDLKIDSVLLLSILILIMTGLIILSGDKITSKDINIHE